MKNSNSILHRIVWTSTFMKMLCFHSKSISLSPCICMYMYVYIHIYTFKTASRIC